MRRGSGGGQHDDIRYRALGWGFGKNKSLEKALRRKRQLSHLQSGCLRGKRPPSESTAGEAVSSDLVTARGEGHGPRGG